MRFSVVQNSLIIFFFCSVVIRREEIDLIADECELTKERAEHLLRKYNGNVQDAIAAFIKGE